MSVIVQLKGHITPYLPSDEKLKKALIDLLNAIDSELDEEGYVYGSDVEDALENLDAAIIGEAIDEDAEDDEDEDEDAADEDAADEDEDELEEDEDDNEADEDEDEDDVVIFEHTDEDEDAE